MKHDPITAVPAPLNSLRPDPAALFYRSAATSVAGAMLLGGNAFAQEETTTPSPTTTMDEVVVTAAEEVPYNPEELASPRSVLPLIDTPRTIDVVPAAVIEAQNASTINEVLRNVPGISIQAGEGGTPAGDQLSIRGFDARTDYFVDGVRDVGGYTRDPFNTEQVEVSKGPGGTDAGRGSTGGSINLVSKTPQSDAFYNAAISGGTDNYYRGTVDINQPFEVWNGAFRLNLMGHDADVPGRDEVHNSRWGIAPSVAFGLGTDTELTFSWFHMEQDNQPDYGIPWVPSSNNALRSQRGKAAPVSFDNYYGLTGRDFEDIVTDIITGEVTHLFNDSLEARLLARYGRTHRDSIITAPRFIDDDSTAIRRSDWKSRDQIDDIFTVVLDGTARFETFDLYHTLVPGFEFSHETQSRRGREVLDEGPTTSLFNPSPGDSVRDGTRHTGDNSNTEADTFAVFLFDTIDITDQWIVSGGARYERFDADQRVDGRTLSRSDDLFNWRAALTYKPVENGAIYFAYGTSSNPSAESLSLTSRSGDLTSVAPEESQTFELGTKWEFFDDRLGLSAAVFQTDKTDARISGVNPNDPPFVLEGEQRVRGFELGVTGQITDWWSVYGGYTYLDSEIVSAKDGSEGYSLPNTPEHSGTIWTDFHITKQLSIGGGARYVGDRGNGQGNTAPDYVSFDAMASYAFSDNLTLQFNVYNLADERYIESVGGGHFIPGPGRSASATLRFTF